MDVQELINLRINRYSNMKNSIDPLFLPTFLDCNAKNEGNIECKGTKCIAHIITRQYKGLTHKKNNRLYICVAHERYFNSRMIEVWFRFVKKNYPDKFDIVRSRYNLIMNEFNKFMEIAKEL